MQRSIDTFTKKFKIGVMVKGRAQSHEETLTDAVKWAKKKYKVKDRYIWESIAVAKRVHARMMARLDDHEVDSNPQADASEQLIYRLASRSSTPAARFLIQSLYYGPRRSTDVLSRASDEGISTSTLRRAVKNTGFVQIRRVGGKDGYWTWELSEKAKKIFLIEI